MLQKCKPGETKCKMNEWKARKNISIIILLLKYKREVFRRIKAVWRIMIKEQIIPKRMWLPLFLGIVFNSAVYYGTRMLTEGRIHYDLSTALDERIPFVPWTIIIYLGCYLFWITNYIIGCRQDEQTAFCFISADLFVKAVCLLCFLVLPTTNTRPVIEGSSIWEEGMRLLYRIDAADNLFPSIHCLTSWFCYIAVRKNRKISEGYRYLSLFIALSICMSTLTTKQHVIVDVAGGIGLSEISYFLVEKTGFARRYRSAVLKISDRIQERRQRFVQKD